MWKLIVVTLALSSTFVYCQLPRGVPVPILSYVNEHNPDGSYRYSYETGNGIRAQAEGFIKNRGIEALEAHVVQGSYRYTAPDGRLIEVTYIADENGFRPTGAHIPRAG